MTCRVDVISIGTLGRNLFWEETGGVRPAHATTALIRDGGTTILVDPSLPADLLRHRLDERTGLSPERIDAVFLTTFLPVHRRGLELFARADWLIHEAEQASMASHLDAASETMRGEGEADPVEIQQEMALLRRTKPAPDQLSPAIHLFPSPGVSPGTCGLLVTGVQTTVVAGDAVISRDHYENGRVFERSMNARQARQSFADIVEIADLIVPGHDNTFVV
jgi:glyoxylase-like metal-dependent hydrolase (beta-lactamase superfamily II)